jgi:hypothetical protein
VGGTLAITAAASSTVVNLTNDTAGVAGNVNIINNTVMDVVGMAGGAAAATATNLSIAAPGDITLAGTNLLAGNALLRRCFRPGAAAYSYGNPGTRTFTPAVDALRLEAAVTGPFGNKFCYTIEAASGVGSVTTRLLDNDDIHVIVVPAAGLPTPRPSPPQIAADPLAGNFITGHSPCRRTRPSARPAPGSFRASSPGGVTPSSAGQVNRVYLEGGDGGGLGMLMVPVVAGDPTNLLVLESTRAGNDRNLITLTDHDQLGRADRHHGERKQHHRCASGATDTLANIATSINSTAAAVGRSSTPRYRAPEASAFLRSRGSTAVAAKPGGRCDGRRRGGDRFVLQADGQHGGAQPRTAALVAVSSRGR